MNRTGRCIASPTRANNRGSMELAWKIARLPVIALAAAMLSAPTAGQGMPFAERLQSCAACHGEDGNSKMENIPSLAGQPEFFIVNQLILMREKVRPVEAMEPFVKDLKDEEAVALAQHFSKLPVKNEERPDPALAK